MRFTIVPVLAILLSGAAHFAEALEWVRKPALAYDERARKWYVTFELDALSDVEASIIDRQSGRVVRHLAAGVLGPNPPGPLMANSLAQTIEWDGRDDYRAAIDNPRSLAVRVRAALGVSLEQIVGGDPYAYYSDEMGDHDHSPWGIGGLEGKADGKVYVWGHSSNLGPPALRQYDIDGNYLQTLFPLPAGKAVESMRGWGIHVKPDGTYVPKYNRVTDPSQSTTFLDGNLQMARLLPTPDRKRLTFWRTGLNAEKMLRGTTIVRVQLDMAYRWT